MASGDRVVRIIRPIPPLTSFATPDYRAGGSTPAESLPVWLFSNSGTPYLDFLARLEKYAGGGLTFPIWFMAPTATSGVVKWELAIRAFPDDAEDIDASQTYDFNAAAETSVASASGEFKTVSITFTNGSDMDSWADGDMAILRLRRNNTTSGTNLAEAAQLVGLFGRET